MKEVIVISLGGSLIVPDKINIGFLEKFKKILLKNQKKYRFVVICGGGNTARNYINGLLYMKNQTKKEFFQCLLGIEKRVFSVSIRDCINKIKCKIYDLFLWRRC